MNLLTVASGHPRGRVSRRQLSSARLPQESRRAPDPDPTKRRDSVVQARHEEHGHPPQLGLCRSAGLDSPLPCVVLAA